MFRPRTVILSTAALIFCIAFSAAGVSAQMAGKPSPSNEPKGAMPNKPSTTKNSLPRIDSREDFDLIARTYHQGTPFSLPHIMFVIDRRAKNKIYFVNSQKFRFHKDFMLATYLIPRGADVFKPVYIDLDRRFMVGTIAWQTPISKFTWELWEGDLASPELIKMANDVIQKAFFEKIAYKPNSIRQEDAAKGLDIDIVTQADIGKNQEYLALNTGRAVGRLHIIDKLDDTVEIGDNEIVVLKELPITLPPVRGIIVAKPSSPLSHVNILARGWDIPNVYIKDADVLLRDKDTFIWEFTADQTSYSFKPADIDLLRTDFVSPDQQVPPVDLTIKRLAPLKELRAKDSLAYGSKSANLGQMMNANITPAVIPDGFSIPFYWYEEFFTRNKFDRRIEDWQIDDNFVHNPRYRREKLDEFRARIIAGEFDPALRAEIIKKWKTQLGGKPVFIRSSSNAEDLPNFSGAGLYSSVPNVRDEDKLIEAVKKVWASLWNFDAYEARVRNYVSQTDVHMSALVQIGVDMQRGGVMITKDPFQDDRKNAVYISSVCGHNSRVVDNTGLPEQLLFNPKSNSVIVLTRSDQTNALAFDENGDLKQVADKCSNAQGRILTDAQARLLATTAVKIKRAFGGKKEQDIEWGMIGRTLYVFQARPFIN
jgi:hypothetical protein